MILAHMIGLLRHLGCISCLLEYADLLTAIDSYTVTTVCVNCVLVCVFCLYTNLFVLTLIDVGVLQAVPSKDKSDDEDSDHKSKKK